MNLRISRLASGLVLALLATPAVAAVPKLAVPKLAVPEVRAVGFDAAQVGGISSLVASEAARHDLKVVSGSDLAALAGFEREKLLMGCSDSGCLAELAGALGVDLLLSSEVSKIGEVWLLSVVLLDAKRNQPVRRTTVRAPNAEEFADLAAGAVHEVLQAYPLVATAAPASSGRRTLGLCLDAAGALALGGGVAFGLLASSAHQDATDLANRAARGEAVDKADFDARWNAAQRDMVIADVLYGVGAVALATGLYFTFTKAGPASPLAFDLVPAPGGATLSFSGVLP